MADGSTWVWMWRQLQRVYMSIWTFTISSDCSTMGNIPGVAARETQLESYGLRHASGVLWYIQTFCVYIASPYTHRSLLWNYAHANRNSHKLWLHITHQMPALLPTMHRFHGRRNRWGCWEKWRSWNLLQLMRAYPAGPASKPATVFRLDPRVPNYYSFRWKSRDRCDLKVTSLQSYGEDLRSICTDEFGCVHGRPFARTRLDLDIHT